jgi:hypothetical protein
MHGKGQIFPNLFPCGNEILSRNLRILFGWNAFFAAFCKDKNTFFEITNKKAARRRLAIGRELLLGGGNHVVNSIFDVAVRGTRATLRWHHTRFALETLERMLVEDLGSLSNPWRPAGLVTELGRSGDTGAMAGNAGSTI